MKRALLVIDVQNEYFSEKRLVTYPEGSLANILQAVDAARANHIPVIVIQHTSRDPQAATFRKGSSGWELHPELAARAVNYRIEKHLPGSFTGTGLEAILRDEGADTVTICGYMTQMCCDTASRQAFHLGYRVEFLADATGTLAFANSAGSVTAEELHRAILVTQASRFAKVLKATEWIGSLAAAKPQS
ncbi:nicotinamidase-related amidase [Hydrogenispora ethanolica]|jgi:nicotinamidase-related amidase|uniref:Nicotinamidase-related amidase n=1 Tax=Hydrogenispora ethanolica TaxID=1082276 RepID=A0A4R1RVQ7_HYDET|nr:cysteine hydrolase family protein [Hydrogenispora ethanolica]TCL70032.1 nicotinamidase-related amidase [Hydrogenispora ethanolica]